MRILEACRRASAFRSRSTTRLDGSSATPSKRSCEVVRRRTRWPGDRRSIVSAGRSHRERLYERCSPRTRPACVTRPMRWTPPIRGSSGCCSKRRSGVTHARRRSCSSRTARRWRCCARRSVTGRSLRPASSTRSCRPRDATRRWPGSARPMVQACWCRPKPEAKAATSSSAAASCYSTFHGNRQSSNNGSGGSIGSAAAYPSRLCTSGRPAASAPTWFACSRR